MSNEHSPIIDSHFHIWRQDFPLTETAWHVPPTEAPLEDIIAKMDERGVIFGVIAAASIHGKYSDYSRSALKKYPRLRSTCMIDTDADIRQMETMKEEGFVGARLMRSLHKDVADITTSAYQLYFRRMRDLDWHIHLVDTPERTPESIKTVEEAGVKLVMDHMGHMQKGINDPGFKAMLAAIERGNTWVKLSCRFRFDDKSQADEYAAQILRVAGTDRVLWGSDWPFADFEHTVTYEKALEDYFYHVPDADMRRKIDETGLRFYFT